MQILNLCNLRNSENAFNELGKTSFVLVREGKAERVRNTKKMSGVKSQRTLSHKQSVFCLPSKNL